MTRLQGLGSTGPVIDHICPWRVWSLEPGSWDLPNTFSFSDFFLAPPVLPASSSLLSYFSLFLEWQTGGVSYTEITRFAIENELSETESKSGMM